MRLLFKQRFFSWFDSYDIYDDNGATVFTVEGKLAWGHCLHILNAAGEHIGTVQQRVLTFLPKFDLYEFDRCIGTIKKEFTFFVPHFTVEGSDWAVEGQFMEWDYTIVSASRGTVATIGKELFHWTTASRHQTAGAWRHFPRSCSTGRTPASSTWRTPPTRCTR